MRDQARWVYEVYRLNRVGVLLAFGAAVLAAVAEIAGIMLYYPIFALLAGTQATAAAGRIGPAVGVLLGAHPGLAILLAALVGVMLVRAVCLYVSRLVSNHYELEFNLRLKRRFLAQLTGARWSFVLCAQPGALLNTFGTYTKSASRGLFYLVELVIGTVSCAAYLAFALYTSPVLALFVFALAVIAVPLLRGIYGRIKRLVELNIELQNQLTAKFLDYLRGFKTLKGMSLERFALAELDRDVVRYTLNEGRSFRIQAGLQAMGEPLFALLGAVFLLGAHYGFAVGLETVVVFFVLLTRSYGRLNEVQSNFGRLVRNAPEIRVCEELGSAALAAAEPSRGRAVDGRIVLLELDDVDVEYPDGTRVLQRVSLRLPVEHGLIAIVGPSGAGKSTLLDVLSGLLSPVHGAYRINGIDVPALDLHALRARMGVVPQSPVLFGRTILENISLRPAAETDASRVAAAARMADAHDFVMRLAHGYDTVMGEAGASLSMGQMQRLSIARALFQDPEILFCDEPTSALDSRAAGEVMRVVLRLAERYPVLLVTHSEEIRRSARTQLVVEDHGVRVVDCAPAGVTR